MDKKLISFVIPCYRSEETIEQVIEEIRQVVAQRPDYDYEVVCVNDYSPDNVSEVLHRIAAQDSKIKLVEFAKNKGKYTAVMAGHRYATGDYIVDMDDDGQSPMPELWKLLSPLINDECDFVSASYFVKKESLFKRFGSWVNMKMVEFLMAPPKGFKIENFSAMKQFVSREMTRYNNPYPYYDGLVLSVTHNVQMVLMDQRERADDNGGGFTFSKSLKLWLDGFTAFSVKPLRVASVLGLIFAFVGFVYAIVLLIQHFLDPEMPMGYASILDIMLVAFGMIMIMLGMLGEYVGRIYLSQNSTSQYTIKSTMNVEEKENKE
ncbi:MAG: YqhA family protein [Pseudobutyrivibrio sp.]|nr:YqhA family protein [Pseudobutyrivibrio sp.]